MLNGPPPGMSPGIATIAAMVTPALLIVGSASLFSSVLVRIGRIVDRARALASPANQDEWMRGGATHELLAQWLRNHARRARYVERAVILLYAAVATFVATCLAIALDRATNEMVEWLPLTLAIIGTLLLLGGAAFMVAESRLSGSQIQDEIRLALTRLADSE